MLARDLLEQLINVGELVEEERRATPWSFREGMRAGEVPLASTYVRSCNNESCDTKEAAGQIADTAAPSDAAEHPREGGEPRPHQLRAVRSRSRSLSECARRPSTIETSMDEEEEGIINMVEDIVPKIFWVYCDPKGIFLKRNPRSRRPGRPSAEAPEAAESPRPPASPPTRKAILKARYGERADSKPKSKLKFWGGTNFNGHLLQQRRARAGRRRRRASAVAIGRSHQPNGGVPSIACGLSTASSIVSPVVSASAIDDDSQ